MVREDVKSDLLAAIGFDAPTKTLMVEFRHHAPGVPPKVYTYHPFTLERFQAFKSAKSIGKYFLNEIKPDSSLTYKRIEVQVENQTQAPAAAKSKDEPAQDETQEG